MKLYYYSDGRLVFVHAKWTKARLAALSALLSATVFVGLITLDHSVGNVLESNSVRTLAAENTFLRKEILSISPKVTRLEIQAKHLGERANRLQSLISRDTLPQFIYATKAPELQSLIRASINARP